MNPPTALTTAALVMSLVSTMLSVIALWPHLKDRLSVVRDAVLWVAVIAVAAGLVLMLNDGPRTFPWFQAKTKPTEPFVIAPYDRETNRSWQSSPARP